MPVETKPIASLKHERGKKRRHRKRTPTGTANRILAPPAPQRCPVNLTGRYQSVFEQGDEGWPMNMQIHQAGTHIEFQIIPALTAEQAISTDKWVIFGGGDFDPGKGTFEIYFYRVKGHAFAAQKGYAPTLKRLRPVSGSLESLRKDRVKLVLTDPDAKGCLREVNVLGRFDPKPTPFIQSLPGLVRLLERRNPLDHHVLTCAALWWPLLRYQKDYLDAAVLQIQANVRAILEAEDVKSMADRVYNLEKRLILTLSPFGTWKWHPRDVPLCRLYLRRSLMLTTMIVGSEMKPILAFMQEAIRLYQARAAGEWARKYDHPLKSHHEAFSYHIHLLRRLPAQGYQPEIWRFVEPATPRFRYKARLIDASELGADIWGKFGGNVLLSNLRIEKYKLDRNGNETHVATYDFLIALLGGSVGEGLTPVSFVFAQDEAITDSPYDWNRQDFRGPIMMGELGGENVSGIGLGLSEEGLWVYGNDPSIPFPLFFDFGDISLRGFWDRDEGEMWKELDDKVGFSVDGGLTVLLGWLLDPADKSESVLIEVNDLQVETPLDPNDVAIGFDFGSALLNQRGRELVGIVAARELYALTQPRTKFAIVAHADLPDTHSRNFELTGLRAKNVYQAFRDALGNVLQVDEDENLTVFGEGDLIHLLNSKNIDTNEEDPEYRRADIKVDARYVTTLRGGGKASVHEG